MRATKGFEILPKKRVFDVETNHSLINCRASKHFDLCEPRIVSAPASTSALLFDKKNK